MGKMFVVVFMASAMALSVSAKTVAFWPLEQNNTRCTIDPRNDLVKGGSPTFADQTIGWNLPPNPDATAVDDYLFKPVNRGEVVFDDSKDLLENRSDHLAQLLDTKCGKDFTLEGFFKLDSLKANTDANPKLICCVTGGTANPDGGWQLAYFNTPSGQDPHRFSLGGNGFMFYFDTLTDDEVTGLTNGWNHFALVYECQSRTSAGSSDWTFYLNGVSKGTLQRRFTKYEQPAAYPVIRIGHHLSASDARTATGRYTCWRLSDTALETTAFLNYDPSERGGTMVPEATARSSRTVAYWKFNSIDGIADVRDYVGDAHLCSLVAANRGDTAAENMLFPSEESAFDGNPLNPTVAFPAGNHGSFRAPTTRLSNLCVKTGDLGATLDVTHPFTVEGYFKPERRTGEEGNSTQAWMFGNLTLSTYRGWTMGMLSASDGRRYLTVYAYNYNGGAKTQLLDTKNRYFCDVSDWGEEWRHVALTYDPAAGADGYGRWKLYLDGELKGTLDNINPVLDADSGHAAKWFYIGGTLNGSFAGCIDAVRVSGAVLEPEQFLCATGVAARAATGVIATWPLNVTAGTGLGGANLEGGYTLFNRDTDFPEGYYLTKTTTDAPNAEIPNPDRSPSFDGDAGTRVANQGSVGFCAGNNQDYAWLATNDKTVMDAFSSEEGWTMEGWVNYDVTNGSLAWTAFGPVFALGDALDQNSISYRVSVWNRTGYTGRVLYQTGDSFGVLSGEPMVTPQLTEKKWYHLAVVHSYFMDASGETPVKMSRLSYYLDGNLQTNVDTVAKTKISTIKWLIFGSNTNGSRGFPGWVNSWRLSRGQLQPSEFLNAAPEPISDPTVEKRTLAYWPLDRQENGALDAEAKEGIGGFVMQATDEGVSASTAEACPRVPNAESAIVDRTNKGSLVLAGANLQADYLGGRLDFDSPWTVEGWICPGEGISGTKTVAGTFVEGARSYGWKLTMTIAGDEPPSFGLVAQPVGCTPIAQGAFVPSSDSMAEWRTGWNHLALVFDPCVGRGTWSLYLNGRLLGTRENAWRNLLLTADAAVFRLGGAVDSVAPSLVGGYDMWRVSAGVLDADELLYRAGRGTVVIFR